MLADSTRSQPIHPLALRIITHPDYFPFIFGRSVFPKDSYRLFCPVRHPRLGGLAASGRIHCIISPHEIDDYNTWIRRILPLRGVCRTMLLYFTPIVNEALWFDHPRQLKKFLQERALPSRFEQFSMVRFLRLDFAWPPKDSWVYWERVGDIGHATTWPDLQGDAREIRWTLPSEEPRQVSFAEIQTSSFYLEALGAFPKLRCFDNGYTGIGCSVAYLPSSPHLFHSLRGRDSLYSLRLTATPVCSDLLGLLPSLRSLEELVLEFVPLHNEDVWQSLSWHNDRLQAMVRLNRLRFLSLTGCRLTRMLQDCQLWWLPNLTHLVIRVPETIIEYLDNLLVRHGSMLTTLELNCHWNENGIDSLEIARFCPRLTTLTLTWPLTLPYISPHPRVREVFLQYTDPSEAFPRRDWPPITLLRSFRSNRSKWSAMERLTDCTIWSGNRQMTYKIWIEQGLPVMDGTGIGCFDRIGAPLTDPHPR